MTCSGSHTVLQHTRRVVGVQRYSQPVTGGDDLSAWVRAAARVPGPAGPAILLPSAGNSDRPFARLLGLHPVTNRPVPFSGTYLTASEYLVPFAQAAGVRWQPDLVWADLLSQHPRDHLLIALALLNHATTNDELGARLEANFLGGIASGLAQRARAALTGAFDSTPRHLLARGPILRTMRAVLSSSSNDPAAIAAARETAGLPPSGMDLTLAATMMTHLVGDAMGSRSSPGEPLLAGMPTSLAMELVQNTLFHQKEDIGDLLGRTGILWYSLDHTALSPRPRRPLPELVQEATGAPIEHLAATGMALWARAQEYAPDRPMVFPTAELPKKLLPYLDESLAVLARTPDDLAAAAQGMTHDWQMLPLQEHPVAILPDGLLVLDETYLMARVTSGLFWLVHDYEKATYGERKAQDWRVNHGDLFEELAESRIKVLAPPVLGPGGSTYFTEDDLARAYPGDGQKRADAGIDFGGRVVLTEIVSGQISVPTRTRGDTVWLDKDLERLVYRKIRQLDSTARRMLTDTPPEWLLGSIPDRIYPVIVQAGQFPYSRVIRTITAEYIGTGYLNDPRIASLAIVGLDDLELVDILRARDHITLPDIIDDWLKSEFHETSLRNFLIATRNLPTGLTRGAARKAELALLLKPIVTILGTTMPTDV